MKYWMSIFFLGLQISVSAQEYRDAKSWLNDMVNSEIILPDDLIVSQPIYEGLIPSISIQEKYYPEFKIESSLFNLSEKAIYTPRWDKDNFYQFKHFKSHWKPSKRLYIEGGNFTNQNMFDPKNLTGFNLKATYKLTNRLSINLYGYYMANDYKNPTLSQSTLYRSEIGGNLSYNITKNLIIKSGMQYQYNVLSRCWEYMYLTGISFYF